MLKALLRQLKRAVGVADESALQDLLELARRTSIQDGLAPEIQKLLSGFGDLVQRVGETYQQYERDLELARRSLELSSEELNAANGTLRSDLASRARAQTALRLTVEKLLPGVETGASGAADELEALSVLLAQLVRDRELSRRQLDHQKFALDQHAIVSITDLQGNITYANERFCAISGYSREELLGQNHRMVASGVHPPEMFQALWQTIGAGQVWHGEICNRTKDGRLYWVNASIVPLLGDDGLPEQYIGIRTDITDRKAMESRLQEQLHLVEELIEIIPLPLYLKDRQGRYLRFNRAFEAFLGIQRQNLLGQTIFDLLPADQAAFLHGKDKELYANGERQTFETRIRARDGKQHDAILYKAPMRNAAGDIIGLLGTYVDISERAAAEAALREAKEAAESASQAKSEFLANMSHEIRTPMNGIMGMTDLVLDTELSEIQREYISLVKSSADSLLTIINDILDFSKIEAGKLQVECMAFDLRRTVADTLKSLSFRAHEKQLELVSDLAPESALPSRYFGDPGRIRQVLVNLIGNAIKFTEAGEVSLRVTGEALQGEQYQLHFEVRDTGIGIPLEKQRLIFDAFSQADSSTTRRFGGTGLGLSISSRLVELMDGRMWVESAPGWGSCFHFTLHLELDPTPSHAASHPDELRGKTILVVDDNATNRRILTGMLAAWGIDHSAVDSGPAALTWLAAAEGPVDAILLDCHMPDMDGYELAATIRRTYGAQAPAMLMLSSGALPGDAQHCQEVGIAGYFSKPIAAEELLAALCLLFGINAQDKSESKPSASMVTRHSLQEIHRTLDILLVEDHPINQRLVVSLFEKWGQPVSIANNGQEALDRLAERSFELIFMDVQMPVMGGFEATEHIRRLEQRLGRPRCPIIAMTANAMQGDREACLAVGMDDYIAKPIKSRQLLECLLAYGGNTQVQSGASFDYSEALLKADRETVEIIAGIFLDTYRHDLDAMRSALAAGNAKELERLAHAQKGILYTFNARPAGELAGEIEMTARTGDLRPELAARIGQLAKEISALETYLGAFISDL